MKLPKNKLLAIGILALFAIGFVFASSVSVWQGQYYTGTTFNTGTYSFNFTVYDSSTGGNICFTNTTSLTTGDWGEWKTEQSPWGACGNASKEYFLNINIDGTDQTPRRRLVVSDFLRRDVGETKEGNLIVSDNITADYFFGNGSFLTGVSGNGDITSVQGDDIYLYNGSDSGDVVLVFNESRLNETIDLRDDGDNFSWNESYADTKYIEQINEGNLNVNSSLYSNSSTWWASISSWMSGWFVNNAGQLGFNDTKLNETIDLKISGLGDNSSWNESYADTKYLQSYTETDPLWNANFTLYNSTWSQDSDTNETARFDNLIGNCSSGNFVSGVDISGNKICDAPAGSGDITSVQGDNYYIYNGSDSGDVVLAFNETKLNSTIDLKVSGLGDNSSWNESYADTKYLQNGTGVWFTEVNSTGNITVEEIHLEQNPANHRIYDNSSCVIIAGDTSTMYIC